jgi:hypothetical protein
MECCSNHQVDFPRHKAPRLLSEYEQKSHQEKCPICGEKIWKVYHNGGFFFCDELGGDWPKHTHSSGYTKNTPQLKANESFPSYIEHEEREIIKPGMLILYSINGEEKLQQLVSQQGIKIDTTKLSLTAPLGKELVKRKSGEKFHFKTSTSTGTKHYEVEILEVAS